MSAVDQQFGAKKEVSFNTPLTVDRFWEMEAGSDLGVVAGRTEGNPLRLAQWVKRSDRWVPYVDHMEGHLDFEVLTKSFGFWLEHMLGSVATTGPAETAAYTHTGTMADLFGKSFTCQMTKPFNPSGTVQAVTASGCKIPSWSIANTVDGMLMLGLDIWGASYTTATATATASYPTLMENFSWAGGVLTVAGSSYDVTDISIEVDNGLNLDRKQIRGNTQPKEPTSGQREVTFTYTADFEALTQHNRVVATTVSAAQAALVATWTGPTLIAGATTLFPKLTVTIPVGRHDAWQAQNAAAEGISQTLSGVGRYDGTTSPITVAVVSADTTP